MELLFLNLEACIIKNYSCDKKKTNSFNINCNIQHYSTTVCKNSKQ
jgi:hypothetical protein